MYTAGRHQEHVKLAMKIFRQQSVGPLQEYYCRKLFCEMDSIWRSGRQRCDAVSLTGRSCSRPLHDGKAINHDAIKRNESAKLAEERHSKFGQDPSGHFSGFSSCHACNCGRTVSKREDPFDLHDANQYFFEKACCQRVAWSYLLYAFSPEDGHRVDDIDTTANDGVASSAVNGKNGSDGRRGNTMGSKRGTVLFIGRVRVHKMFEIYKVFQVFSRLMSDHGTCLLVGIMTLVSLSLIFQQNNTVHVSRRCTQ